MLVDFLLLKMKLTLGPYSVSRTIPKAWSQHLISASGYRTVTVNGSKACPVLIIFCFLVMCCVYGFGLWDN